jgi:cell division protein FtsI (penicillin-binding protein 3)
MKQQIMLLPNLEPGSTYKLVDLMTLLKTKKLIQVRFLQYGGIIRIGKAVRDSHKGGYGKISLARGFEVSSNTVMVQAVIITLQEQSCRIC